MARTQARTLRTIARVPVVPGGFAIIDLPRGYDYSSLVMRINGSVQLTTAGTAVRAEAPTQMVARVEVTADGRNVLHNAPFWRCAVGRLDRRLTDYNTQVIVPPSSAAIGTYAVEATGIIDFCVQDGLRPKDANFRTSALQLFQMRLTFGNPQDLFTGAAVGTFNGCYVDICAIEMIEVPDASGVITTPLFYHRVSTTELAIPASNTQLDQRLPAGNAIRSVLMRTEGLTTAGEPTNGVINNIQLRKGLDVRANLSGANLRAINRAVFGNVQTGLYLLDLTRIGETAYLSEAFDVSDTAEPMITMDVVGGASVRMQIVTEEFVPYTPLG